MVFAAFLGMLASANPDVSPKNEWAFIFDNGGLEVAIGMPEGPLTGAFGDLRGRSRACPVGLWVDEGSLDWRPDDSCHPLAFGPVSEEVARWSQKVEGRLGPDRVVGELVFVFGPGARARRGEDTAMYVVPQAGTRFVLRDDRVQRYAIRADALFFPTYPADVPADTRLTQCDVRLEVDRFGSAEDIRVSRCEERFVEPTRSAMMKWHFNEVSDDALPYRLVRFGARFVRAPEHASFGEVTFFEPDGIRAERAEVIEVGVSREDDRSVPAKPAFRTIPKLSASQQSIVEERLVCRFEVDVSAKGKPTTIRAQDCPDGLVPACIKAIRKWRWTPASRDDEAVASTTEVTLRFDPRAAR